MSPGTVSFALVAFFAGSTVLVAATLGALTRAGRPEELLRRRLALYTVAGPDAAAPALLGPSAGGPLASHPMTRPAVDLAAKVVQRRQLATLLDQRLDAAGLLVRAAEWVVLHVAVAVVAAVGLMLLTGGGLTATLLGLAGGLVGPWLFLRVRQERREREFLGALPDTLTMIAGSLQAGFSLSQALTSCAGRGEGAIGTELRRALLETRLGLTVEDALEGVGRRMDSDDFSWAVLAIRIQREVGGNLAELLLTVAETLRERDRLRRQVQVLSAEGRLSGLILGSLPVLFTGYLVAFQPGMLAPMLSGTGLVLGALSLLLLVVGGFWLARIAKVEV